MRNDETCDKILIGPSIFFFVAGRVCDNLNRYAWAGMSPDLLEGLLFLGLTISTAIIIWLRCRQGRVDRLLLNSILKFFTPWGLTILLCILLFNVYGCH